MLTLPSVAARGIGPMFAKAVEGTKTTESPMRVHIATVTGRTKVHLMIYSVCVGEGAIYCTFSSLGFAVQGSGGHPI